MELNTDSLLFYQYGLTLIGIILYFLGKYFIRKLIKKRAIRNSFDIPRVRYMRKIFNAVWAFVVLMLISIIWDVSFEGLSIYFASVFAVIGVAFFAQWSMISNITASIILFFNYSYRIGNRLKILDGENSVTGKIVDIQLFYFRIETDEGNEVSYPNNLVIQKPIILFQNN